MAYTPYYENGWQSGQAGGTPITPAALNHMENGIEAANSIGIPVDIAHGGTGSTTAVAALAALGAFPAVGGIISGNINYVEDSKGIVFTADNEKYVKLQKYQNVVQLITNATESGTVTSVIAMDLANRTLKTYWRPWGIDSGGTGATTAAAARANLQITASNIGAVSTSGSSTIDSGAVYRTDGDDYSTAPSAQEARTIVGFKDSENEIRHQIYVSRNTSNDYYTWIQARKNSGISNQIGIGLDASGNDLYYVKTGSAFRNAIGASSGVWPVSVGGTGLSSSPSMLTNLGSTTAADVFAATPRPGITGTLGVGHGGTGSSTSPTQGGIIYASSTSAYASTAAGTFGQYLKSNGTGAPTWATFSASTVGLGNVENTKLSTWTGSSNITTLGTISTGTWHGSTIGAGYGGTGLTSSPSMLTNLGSTTAANVFQATPRPGVTGTLGIANGGTGVAASSLQELALGLDVLGRSPLAASTITDANNTSLIGCTILNAGLCANLPTSTSGVFYHVLFIGHLQIAFKYTSSGFDEIWARDYNQGWKTWTSMRLGIPTSI